MKARLVVKLVIDDSPIETWDVPTYKLRSGIQMIDVQKLHDAVTVADRLLYEASKKARQMAP